MSKAKPAPEKASQSDLLPLDSSRTVALKVGNNSFLYHFRRITQDDWTIFYRSIVHRLLQFAGSREEVFETESAIVELIDRTLTRVEGYGDTSSVTSWKLALPLSHRMAVGSVLRGVGVSKADTYTPVLCDLQEVRLVAAWSSDGEGKMRQYDALVHRFRHPSIEDLKRFNFESSRVKVSGTADNGVTVYPSRQAIAMKIYDDLIESVEGYSVNGEPLYGVDDVRREMDGAHKAAAALQIFAPEGDIRIE